MYIYCQSQKNPWLVLRPEESAAWFLLFFFNIYVFSWYLRMVCPVQSCMTLTNYLDTETWRLVVMKSGKFYHVQFRCISLHMYHQKIEWLKPWYMEGNWACIFIATNSTRCTALRPCEGIFDYASFGSGKVKRMKSASERTFRNNQILCGRNENVLPGRLKVSF